MARIGSQMPTQSAIIPYTETKGNEAAKLYALTGKELMEWQQGVLKNMMAVTAEGLWTHIKFGYSVSRRNGKTEMVYAREMWGLLHGEKILHTAHRTDTAHSSWECLYELLKKTGIPIEHTFRANGREHIFITGGGRIEYRTRTSKVGLGQGYDLLVIDEAQEYQDDQETALKYIVTASKNPQIIMLGTPPTAVSSGDVFNRLRSEILAGKTTDSGWEEWSVESQHDPHDVDAWYLTNPALGITLKERDIAAEITGDSLDFNIQRLGLWIKYDLKSAIPEAEWEALKVKNVPKLDGKLCVGIKYGKDGENVSMSIAVRTATGKIFVEAIDCRPIRNGDTWMLKFLKTADIAQVIIDGASGQQLMKEQMHEAKIKPIPVLPTVKEVITANAVFEQALEAKEIRHAGQKSLTQAVTNCDKRVIGSNGGFGFKSLKEDIDISLMDSMILAHWACTRVKKRKKQKVSY